MENSFKEWFHWNELETRKALLNVPGVYVLAISDENIAGQPFSWLTKIAYIGMTNSKGGLISRLRQFDRTISGGEGHGGGCRLRYVYRDYSTLVQKLYVAVCPFECENIELCRPRELRVKGEVARMEYECFARYVEIHNELPEFNRPGAIKLTAKDLANKSQERTE